MIWPSYQLNTVEKLQRKVLSEFLIARLFILHQNRLKTWYRQKATYNILEIMYRVIQSQNNATLI